MWLAPHLPMLDLPQHAGQVALLRDLLSGTSLWSDLVRVNLFTPYLFSTALALPLSFVLPVNTVFALLLSLSYVGLVSVCVWLRHDLNGDERLDWLFVPGFFGFAWKFGFIPFLVASSIGVVFIFFYH